MASTTEAFSTPITVRGYELDTNGHLYSGVYWQYGDHARWEILRAAGITIGDMTAAGIGPITLETTVRFHHELRVGDEVEATCAFVWGEGKTFRIEQEVRRVDGVLAAELSGVGGLLDLATRRLLPDPGPHWRALAAAPAVLGL